MYIFIDKHFQSKYILPSTILTVKFDYNEMNEVIGISAFFWMIHEEKWDYQRIERIHNELVWLNNEQMTSLYITHRTLSHNSLMLLDLKGFAILEKLRMKDWESFLRTFYTKLWIVNWRRKKSIQYLSSIKNEDVLNIRCECKVEKMLVK